ncbi:MAG: hypothetical protein OEZ13_11625 [Spirochaetia bacterium]|nr:hypothetical protein [Spirochaetia bacterium]
MKNKTKSVLIITANPHEQGWGHLARMKILSRELNKNNIHSDLITSDNITSLNSFLNCDLVILDDRDSAFPEQYLLKKKIAIDNRGIGRSQADFIWDTLPHFSMSGEEFLLCLDKILLHPKISKLQSKSVFARINKIEKTKNQYDKNKLSHEQFIEEIIKSTIIECYFGQTLFESIYLGKEIRLYDIGDYHKKLSNWFLKKWNSLSNEKKLIDGKGLKRLVDFIINI